MQSPHLDQAGYESDTSEIRHQNILPRSQAPGPIPHEGRQAAFPSAPREGKSQQRSRSWSPERFELPDRISNMTLRHSKLPEYNFEPQHTSSPNNPVIFQQSLRDISSPEKFSTQDPHAWMDQFELWVSFKLWEQDDKAKIGAFALLLSDRPSRWWHSSGLSAKSEWTQVKSAFLERFSTLGRYRFKDRSKLWSLRQTQNQPVSEFIQEVQSLAKLISADSKDIYDVIVNGVKPTIQQFLLSKQITTLADLIHWCRLAEDLIPPHPITQVLRF